MRIAHLILTYTDPQQTERMIKNLCHPSFDFYIHVDKKIDITSHLPLANIPNVYLIQNRVEVRWAGYNTVKATFSCIKEIAATGKQYDYINFLSGQDYPIKSANYILEFLKNNNGKLFIEAINIEQDVKEDLTKLNRYHFVNLKFWGKYKLEKLFNFLLGPRKIPLDLVIYGKAMFWMLTQEAANYVVERVEKNQKLLQFFQYSWGCDEFVFQTILMNSHYKDFVTNNHCRYIDWSAGGPHPKTLGKEDFEQIMASEHLFARKFKRDHDEEILDLIDQHIHSVHNGTTTYA
ncbi:MAG: beta-1,6-N-acetylglucosaminyltransferase [Chitinophagaceae bacterium]